MEWSREEKRSEDRDAYDDRGVAGEKTLTSAPSLRGGTLLPRVELLARTQLALLQRALAERHLRHAALVSVRVQYNGAMQSIYQYIRCQSIGPVIDCNLQTLCWHPLI